MNSQGAASGRGVFQLVFDCWRLLTLVTNLNTIYLWFEIVGYNLTSHQVGELQCAVAQRNGG